MTRLRALEIYGFRGILDVLRIDLGGQSLAIHGENGTGKSSIADALEWFYTGRVKHLWKENCKESALRNTRMPDSATSRVSLFFDDKRLDCTRTLTNTFDISYSNSNVEFKEHLQAIATSQERIILRNVDLWNFVLSTKTEKREDLADLIGYESLDSFRETITRTQKRLEETPDYVAAKRNIPEYHKEMFKIAGHMLVDDQDLHNSASRIASSVGVASIISDESSYTSVIDELRKRIENKEKTALKLALVQCRESFDQLKSKAVESKKAYVKFEAVFADLIKSDQDVRQVRLETLLSLGENAIKEGLSPADTCPLCLQPKPWPLLRRELELRIVKLKESKRKADQAALEKAKALAALSETVGIARELYASSKKASLGETFLATLAQYGITLKGLDATIKANFDKLQAISSNIESDTEQILAAIDERSDSVKLQIQALELSKEEQQLFDAARSLENLKLSYDRYRGASETVLKFEQQIRTIAAISDSFAKIHASALQNILDMLTNDISRFYLTMHPGEPVDHIRLTVLEGGVEFEYGFHGRRVYPPLKYLSESHMNSLVIAAFLASAKLFNKSTNFLVLDDIVSSFDSNHRVRLVQLLHEEFSGWQILLLTHEPFWFEIIKKQLLPKGWLVSDLEAGPGPTLKLKASAKQAREDLIRKKADGSLAANDLRNGFERILKELAASVGVKVAFRYNDENERRMIGELLSELRATLKKKSPSILSKPVFSRLETCNLVVTTGSHDSGPVLSSGDLAAAYEDILDLDAVFFCDVCGTHVTLEKYVGHEKKVFCKCGKKSLDWKE